MFLFILMYFNSVIPNLYLSDVISECIIYKSINKMKLFALLGLVAVVAAEECPHDL